MNEANTVERKIEIEPLATPYRAFIPVEEAEIQKVMDKSWEDNKDHLIQIFKYKGKKGKGGKLGKAEYDKARSALEQRLGLSRVHAWSFDKYGRRLIEEEFKKEVAWVNGVTYHNTEDPILLFNFYFYPVLTLEGELDYKVKRPAFPSFETELEGRITDLKWRKRIWNKIEEVNQESEVVIDLTTTKDGVVYAPETIKNYRKEVKFMELADLAKSLIGKKAGDFYEIEYSRDATTFKHRVKIYEVYDLILRSEDDPVLFEDENVSSMVEFKAKCEDEYEQNLKTNIEGFVFATLIDRAIAQSRMESIPQPYLDKIIESLMEQHGSKNEKLYDLFGQQALQGIVHKMAGDWYIREHNLGKDAEYNEIVVDMMHKVEWIE